MVSDPDGSFLRSLNLLERPQKGKYKKLFKRPPKLHLTTPPNTTHTAKSTFPDDIHQPLSKHFVLFIKNMDIQRHYQDLHHDVRETHETVSANLDTGTEKGFHEGTPMLDRTSVAAILKEVKEWVGWLGRGKHTVEY
jgi:hypothetical protein